MQTINLTTGTGKTITYAPVDTKLVPLATPPTYKIVPAAYTGAIFSAVQIAPNQIAVKGIGPGIGSLRVEADWLEGATPVMSSETYQVVVEDLATHLNAVIA